MLASAPESQPLLNGMAFAASESCSDAGVVIARADRALA